MAVLPGRINRVKVLGVRTEVDARVLFHVNYSVYSLLIEFQNGDRKLLEVRQDKMDKYLPYIDMDY